VKRIVPDRLAMFSTAPVPPELGAISVGKDLEFRDGIQPRATRNTSEPFHD
jgi:hypothetical protein